MFLRIDESAERRIYADPTKVSAVWVGKIMAPDCSYKYTVYILIEGMSFETEALYGTAAEAKAAANYLAAKIGRALKNNKEASNEPKEE